jgi:hypothetical protein
MAERMSWSVRTLQEQTIMVQALQTICHGNGIAIVANTTIAPSILSSTASWIHGIDLDYVCGLERQGLKE